jgi:hypothetical protein
MVRCCCGCQVVTRNTGLIHCGLTYIHITQVKPKGKNTTQAPTGQGVRRVPQKWKKVIHTKAAPKQSRAQ